MEEYSLCLKNKENCTMVFPRIKTPIIPSENREIYVDGTTLQNFVREESQNESLIEIF